MIPSSHRHGSKLWRLAACGNRPMRLQTVPEKTDAMFGFGKKKAHTPEVEAALGVTIGHDRVKLESAGRAVLEKLGCQAVLVTRGSHGMALFEAGQPTVHIPIHGTDQVADVTGAGDTVIATLATGLAAWTTAVGLALRGEAAGRGNVRALVQSDALA